MYKVHIKGSREPITINDDVKGKQLQDNWMANNLSEKIQIGDDRILSSNIKGISEFKEENHDQKSKMHDMIQETNQRFANWRAQLLSKTPLERAKNTQVARLVAYAINGTHEVPEGVTEAQEDYFKTHPKNAVANPICYKDKMKFRPHAEESNVMEHISGRLRLSALELAERVAGSDMNSSRYD